MRFLPVDKEDPSTVTLWKIQKVPPYIKKRLGPSSFYPTSVHTRERLQMSRDFNSTSDPRHPGLRVRFLTMLTLRTGCGTESERSIFKDCVATAVRVLAGENQSLNGSGAT